ncbi:MAG: hypothetical protein R2864_09500 [Syntrophotaleaceae bacterium]
MYPDGFVGYVEERQMTPFFQAGRVGAGIEATVELLVARAFETGEADGAVEGGEVTSLPHLSGGGGARVTVELGSGAPDNGAVAEGSLCGGGLSGQRC